MRRWVAVVGALFSVLLLLSGCAVSDSGSAFRTGSESPDLAGGETDTFTAPSLTPSQQDEAFTLARRVEDHAGKREDRIDWYRSRYMGLGARGLGELAEADLAVLRDRVAQKNGTAYVIVHPAYYLYFQERSRALPYRSGDPSYNLVERYLSFDPGKRPVDRLMWEQVRIEMEFLTYAAAEHQVVILVVPGEYRRHPLYRFSDDALDEYARYLNEVTDHSETFFYVESKSVTRGFLTEDALETVETFLRGVGAERILLGGGFVGRCQEDLYQDLLGRIPSNRVAVVAELSSVSYADVDDAIAANLLSDSLRLNPAVAFRNIRTNVYKRLDSRPKVVSLLRTDPVIGSLVLRGGLSTADAGLAVLANDSRL